MAKNFSNTFTSVSHFFADVSRSVMFAREANSLYNTPESVFRARGTTRDAAVRALMKRI